jgi:hypothetical protein
VVGEGGITGAGAGAAAATPPWCEQAPRPAFDVVPSLHVTGACAIAIVGAATASAHASVIVRNIGTSFAAKVGR